MSYVFTVYRDPEEGERFIIVDEEVWAEGSLYYGDEPSCPPLDRGVYTRWTHVGNSYYRYSGPVYDGIFELQQLGYRWDDALMNAHPLDWEEFADKNKDAGLYRKWDAPAFDVEDLEEAQRVIVGRI